MNAQQLDNFLSDKIRQFAEISWHDEKIKKFNEVTWRIKENTITLSNWNKKTK